MEADRIEIKTVLISVVVVAVIEAAVGIAASTGAYSSTPLLGAARLLEAVLIVLIVLNREKGTVLHRFGPVRHVFRAEKGACLVGRFRDNCAPCLCGALCRRH